MSVNSPSSKIQSTRYILTFIFLLSLFAGLALATVSYVLNPLKQRAKEFDRNSQMCMSARILYQNSFYLPANNRQPAVYSQEQRLLLPVDEPVAITSSNLHAFAQAFIRPLVTNNQGIIYSPEDLGLSIDDGITNNAEWHLFYAIVKNESEWTHASNKEIAQNLQSIYAVVIPVEGFGLWGEIHGYLAIQNDGETVLGASWYEHAETPGLGANISNPQWLEQFPGKTIFQKHENKQIDYQTAPLGLKVLKGNVANQLPNSPLANSSLDGISGATLTCQGVSQAYSSSLEPYRQLFINMMNTK